MDWDDAEALIRAHIEAGWAAGAYAAIPLLFENETAVAGADYSTFLAVSIEGVYAEKTGYGSTGKRVSVEGGIVFFHCFVPKGRGKALATGPIVLMTQLLELQTVGTGINLEGGAPPSPAAPGDDLVPSGQPRGNYYRCSGSVPFMIIGSR